MSPYFLYINILNAFTVLNNKYFSFFRTRYVDGLAAVTAFDVFQSHIYNAVSQSALNIPIEHS